MAGQIDEYALCVSVVMGDLLGRIRDGDALADRLSAIVCSQREERSLARHWRSAIGATRDAYSHEHPWSGLQSANAGVHASLETDDKATTEGVLYNISNEFIDFLDLHEEGYRREQVTVEAEGKVVKAYAYIANEVREGLRPKREYLDVMRIAAKQLDLTSATAELQNVETLSQTLTGVAAA
jgi:hypothetical protein